MKISSCQTCRRYTKGLVSRDLFLWVSKVVYLSQILSKMFKKTLSILSLSGALFVANMLSAQSFQIVDADSVVYGNANTTLDMASHIKLKNVSNRPLNVHVKRLDVNYNALTDSNAICWGICYTTATSQTPFASPMQPDSVYEEFSGHVYPDLDGVLYSGPITYVFFDEINPTDSIAHTIWYTLTSNFGEEEAAAIEFSVYPNPAKDVLTLQADRGVQTGDVLRITSLEGRVVQEEVLSQLGAQTIDVSTLSSGVYMYSLSRDQQQLLAKKLVIE